MATNTKLLQAMADVMLPLFNNMPRVVLAVKDHSEFHKDRAPLAIYDSPYIVVNPNHPPTSTFDDLKGTICHELIHAWLDRRGLHRAGLFLDDHHNEWFVKKALEINNLNIDGLKVDLSFLLTTPQAVEIYNRIAGTRITPPPANETIAAAPTTPDPRNVTAKVTEPPTRIALSKEDNFLHLVIIWVLVVIASVFLNNASLAPDAVAGFIWRTWAITVLIWLAIETWKEFSSRRLSRTARWSLGAGVVALVCLAIWFLRMTFV
jgi:hypothetical protein